MDEDFGQNEENLVRASIKAGLYGVGGESRSRPTGVGVMMNSPRYPAAAVPAVQRL